MIKFKHSGSFKNSERFLTRVSRINVRPILERYAQEGVRALSAATPVDTGETARSWGYEVTIARGSYTINWTNSNMNGGVSVALLIQYGHGTRNGTYVTGRDYINPAIRPIFDKIEENLWEEVTRL